MGAPNFGSVATDKIYAIWMDKEVEVLDEDGMPTGEINYETVEEWESNEDLDWFAEVFEQIKLPKYTYKTWDGDHKSLFTLSSSKHYTKQSGEVEVEVQVEGFITYGYHEGAVLDFQLKLLFDGYEQDTYEDSEDVCVDLGYWNSGFSRVEEVQVEKWANKWAKKELEKLTKIANKYYASICGDKLIKVAQFSNGEAMYQKID